MIPKPTIDWKSYLGRLSQYKYIAIVVLVGILLIAWPDRDRQKQEAPAAPAAASEAEERLETQLSRLLSQVDGAGATEVILTRKTGTETIYQTDVTISTSEDLATTTETTVTNGGDPLVRKTQYPIYQGALVVCEGADRASVRLEVTSAVSSLTGLGADKITVIKMK